MSCDAQGGEAVLIIEPLVYLVCAVTIGISSAFSAFPLKALEAVDEASQLTIEQKSLVEEPDGAEAAEAEADGGKGVVKKIQFGRLSSSSMARYAADTEEAAMTCLQRFALRLRLWTENRLMVLLAISLFHLAALGIEEFTNSSTGDMVEVRPLGTLQIRGFRIMVFLWVVMISAWSFIFATLREEFQVRKDIHAIRVLAFRYAQK